MTHEVGAVYRVQGTDADLVNQLNQIFSTIADRLDQRDATLAASVETVTEATYRAGAESIILVDDDLANGDVSVLLPAAAESAHVIYFLKKLGTTGDVTAQPDGENLIDGSSTASITTQYNSLTITCDGKNWFKIQES